MKDGVIRAQLFDPKYLERATLKAAAPLPAEIKRTRLESTLFF